MSLEHQPLDGLRSAEELTSAADFLKALGHPLRLHIVAVLAEGPHHVTALAERLGVPQAIVSQQLRILRMSELVAALREKGQAIYRLTDTRVIRLLGCLQGHR